MTFADFAQAVFALVLVLGLIGLSAVALRRFGPDALSRFVPARKERRIRIVETLVLDPARRLVIVDVDGKEQLLLLGEGRVLGHEARRGGADA